jgi:hypothetical protein
MRALFFLLTFLGQGNDDLLLPLMLTQLEASVELKNQLIQLMPAPIIPCVLLCWLFRVCPAISLSHSPT